jgi:predicted alpha/beta-hydrolase family hydrolase
MDDRGMQRLSGALRARGFGIVRFNFLYREKGASRPDAMPRLKACMAAVVERARVEYAGAPLIIGGRSMGGRTASMLAAEGLACDGVLLLAYPLHPAGKPEQLRDSHLPLIRVPVLCLSGTRDPLCQRELMERVLTAVQTSWKMHWLEGADHSFRVLKSSGKTDAEVLEEIGEASRRWLAGLRTSH